MKKIQQIQNNENLQYFELQEIQKYDLDQQGRIIYRKFQSKICVLYKQKQFYDILYFEKEQLKYYKRIEQREQSYEENFGNFKRDQTCFCGELKYFFKLPYEANLLKICLQTGEETEYTFENNFPNNIGGVKNSNLIILQNCFETELRDAKSFTVIMKLKNLDYNEIFLKMNGFFKVKNPYQFFRRQIKINKNIQMFNLNLKHFFSDLVELENHLIIQNLRLRSLQLKGKILRKIFQKFDQNDIMSFRLKKYHNQCYLKLKAQFFVSFEEYDWKTGQLQYNENMKQIFDGFLTFREGSTSYYFLRYVPVNHDQNDKTISIKKFDSQKQHRHYICIFPKK